MNDSLDETSVTAGSAMNAANSEFIGESPAKRAGDILGTSQSIVVLLGDSPGFDQVAAATALAVSWLKLGKDVVLASPAPLAEDVLSLVGSELCKNELANQDLTISFPYTETAVNKVSYHISDDQQRFTLVIKPQKGTRPLDASQVAFGYVGVDADLLFLVGVHSFDDLGTLYQGKEDVYQRATTVVIHTFEPEIGLIKLNIGDTSCFSEGVARLLSQWHTGIAADAATNLLAGIYEATDSLRSWAVTAETFETVAWLLRQGGRRPDPKKNTIKSNSLLGPVPTLSSVGGAKPTNPLASAMMKNAPTKSIQESTDGETIKEMKPNGVATKPKTKAKSAKKTASKPGSLDYEPSGFGPGGNG